jgi:hypothetical protein
MLRNLIKFREELIVYFTLVRHGPHRKQKTLVGYRTHRQQIKSIRIALKNLGDTQTDIRMHKQTQRHRQQGDLINLTLFFQNK